jgi:hypothetical protein
MWFLVPSKVLHELAEESLLSVSSDELVGT